MRKGLDTAMTMRYTCTAQHSTAQRITALTFVRPFFSRIILLN